MAGSDWWTMQQKMTCCMPFASWMTPNSRIHLIVRVCVFANTRVSCSWEAAVAAAAEIITVHGRAHDPIPFAVLVLGESICLPVVARLRDRL